MTVMQPLSDWVIILDLDGTLVDSAPDLTRAMNVVLEEQGLSPLALEEVRHLVGHGAKALLTAGFKKHGIENIAEEEMDRNVQRFIDFYKEHSADLSKPFSGCEDCLKQLQTLGAKLAVCTNKREELTFPLLEALNLSHYFQAIICRDTLPVYKPDPAPLLACLIETNTTHGIMIGDTITDLEASIRAEMPCVIAQFGYGDFEDERIKKARQFSSFKELPSLIENIAQKAN